uniref:Uncharacterized protein n=1 Tax=uncultured bacterium contig00053 TaxID=1181537 RepID=A0A806KMW6_9BACT|nr:hypothetical protein [uncultured bacterium contig00053]
MRSTIIDWDNRNMGVEPFPAWLKAYLINNREDLVRNVFGLNQNTVIRIGQAERANREEARVLADLMFAQQIAFELKSHVDAGAAQRLDRGNTQVVEETTRTAKVDIAGARALPSFWQQIEKDDNGVKTRSYIWYTVYVFEGDTWDQMTAKYLYDVVGQIPDSAVRQQIAAAFDEINRQARRKEERSDAEFQHMIEMQVKQVDNLHEQELAQTAANASVARTQAEAEAEARYWAYRSGDPVAATAAALTANDTDWVRALATIASIVD